MQYADTDQYQDTYEDAMKSLFLWLKFYFRAQLKDTCISFCTCFCRALDRFWLIKKWIHSLTGQITGPGDAQSCARGSLEELAGNCSHFSVCHQAQEDLRLACCCSAPKKCCTSVGVSGWLVLSDLLSPRPQSCVLVAGTRWYLLSRRYSPWYWSKVACWKNAWD